MAQASNPESGVHRTELQSLRGLAALSVLMGHAALVLDWRASPVFRLQSVLFEANSAVVVFYVLSGFVLGQSLERAFAKDARLALPRFALARLFRLLPVFWASILLAAAVSHLAAAFPLSHTSDWLQGAAVPAGGAAVLRGLFAFATDLNGSLWSVTVELWMIALLPALFLVARKTSLGADCLIILALSLFARATMEPLRYTPWIFATYINAFYVGLVLPKFIASLGAPFTSGIGAALALFLMLFLQYLTASGFDFWTKLVLDAPLSAIIIAWASAAAAPSPARRFLRWRPIARLGDVSYSFYGFSIPVLVATSVPLLHLLPSALRTAPWGIALLTVLLCPLAALALLLPLSALSYRLLELPTIRLGKRCAAWLLAGRDHGWLYSTERRANGAAPRPLASLMPRRHQIRRLSARN